MPKVSIIIVSFNTRDLLDKSIASVFAGSPDIEKEVIIVENASVDGSREMLAEKYPNVRVIYNDDNRGYAPACNQGLRVATGDYVLALNSDAFVVDDALSTMMRYMDEHPEVSALGPKLLNQDGSTQLECARSSPSFLSNTVFVTPWLSHIAAMRRYCQRRMPLDFYEKANDVGVILGAALFFRKEALSTVGYLDDRLIVNGDDIEWCMRAHRMGCKLIYYPEAEVIHVGCASRGFDSSKMQARNIESMFNFFDALYGWPGAAILKFVMMSNIAQIFLRNALIAPFRADRRERAASQWRLLVVGWRLSFSGKRRMANSNG
jgi:GT2 family glycosyltransferase